MRWDLMFFPLEDTQMEEGVDLGACDLVRNRILVHDEDVLEDECRERLEVDFFESYLALHLFRKVSGSSFCNCSLHLWQLYRDRYCEHKCQDGYNRQPDYFQRLFDNLFFLVLQLAKIIKISDKIRIFVA